MMSDNFEVGEENQMALGTTSTNVKWPFQHDRIKREVVDVSGTGARTQMQTRVTVQLRWVYLQPVQTEMWTEWWMLW